LAPATGLSNYVANAPHWFGDARLDISAIRLTDHSWREFCTKVLKLDIVIDDGGHEYEQQDGSLEELT
jgi:hypothetical protein